MKQPPSLALAIRHLRKDQTCTYFARQCGVTRQTIYAWEAGSVLSISNLRDLVQMGLNPAYLHTEHPTFEQLEQYAASAVPA